LQFVILYAQTDMSSEVGYSTVQFSYFHTDTADSALPQLKILATPMSTSMMKSMVLYFGLTQA